MKAPVTALLALLCLSTPAVAQTGVEDQISPFGSEVGTANDALINFGLTTLEWQATVQAGIPGYLEGIQFEVSGPAGDSFDIRVYLGAPWQSGTPTYTTTLTKSSGSVEIMYADFTASGISLAVGDFYTISVGGQSNTWMIPDYPPLLTVSGTPGGLMDFQVDYAEPNGPVAYLYAFGTGSHSIVNPLTGTQMVTGLASQGFTVVAWPSADANGTVVLGRTVPAGAAGLVCVQAVDLVGDQVSNVVCL